MATVEARCGYAWPLFGLKLCFLCVLAKARQTGLWGSPPPADWSCVSMIPTLQPSCVLPFGGRDLRSGLLDSDNLWWDAFATEFFEDDATLTLSFCLEDGPKRYTIGRTLIPRYFSTVFEGGVTDLYYILKHSKESYHNSSITVDCDQCAMVTQHGKPMFTKVCTEGRLILEFTFDDLMRIKTWHFTIRQYRELVPRSILAMHAQDPQVLDQLSKNITRMGLTNFTLNYLRLCVILEPMQELMSRHKTYNLSPRDCLKTCLFQKWQRMVAPPAEPTRQPTTKRRKRKNSTSSTSNSSAGNNANSTGSKKKTPAANLSLSSQGLGAIPNCSLNPGRDGDLYHSTAVTPSGQFKEKH
ncbi:LIM domain-binding protein 2 isoform X6 [Sus scrofa]|uniref:LIM domain-binding protein 2 isoform X6 n=1 Tax=Sus scrofa TaxID=9823 RepID=UPI000A2B1949|nr:LIM domain-binding protein 2 isoform X6 [Sus scrofa]